MILNVEGRKINFILDTRATYSVLNSSSGPLPSKSSKIMGVEGNLPYHLSIWEWNIQMLLFYCSSLPYLSVRLGPFSPNGTILLFSEEPLESSMFMIISRSQNQEEILSSVPDAVNLLVWESGIPRRAKTALPIKIHLKPRSDILTGSSILLSKRLWKGCSLS